MSRIPDEQKEKGEVLNLIRGIIADIATHEVGFLLGRAVARSITVSS